MIPVEVACLACLNNFKLFVPNLVSKFFKATTERFSWSFLYKCRSNNKFHKSDFFDLLSHLIPENYYHLAYNGDMIFLVDITQHFMCMSVFDNFEKYKKYSFMSLLKTNEEKEDNEEQSNSNEKEAGNSKINLEIQTEALEIHDIGQNPDEDICLF